MININNKTLLDFFDMREQCMPFSVVKLERGCYHAIGEWDGFVYKSKRVKKRLLKRLLKKGNYDK